TVRETRVVMEHARAAGFRSVNLDLIYGLPRQTPDGWRHTLDEVVALAPDRVAVFSFAYVPDAKPHQRRLPVADLPHGRAKLALGRGHVLDGEDRGRRALSAHLMCNVAVDLGERLAHDTGAIAQLEADGLLVRDGTRLRLTPLGRPFVRNVAMAFDAYLPRTG